MRKTLVSFLIFAIVSVFSIPLSCLNVQAGQDGLNAVQVEAEKGGYQLIDLDGLWSLYQSDKDALLLVDTRQEWEYHSGYIQGAVNFPMEPTWLARITQRGALDQFLGGDKSQTIVFY